MVAFAHTIAYPGTVMVHSENTSSAHRAVMGSWWSNRCTLHAVAPVDETPCRCCKLGTSSILNSSFDEASVVALLLILISKSEFGANYSKLYMPLAIQVRML